jgi:hypothetical protein
VSQSATYQKLVEFFNKLDNQEEKLKAGRLQVLVILKIMPLSSKEEEEVHKR